MCAKHLELENLLLVLDIEHGSELLNTAVWAGLFLLDDRSETGLAIVLPTAAGDVRVSGHMMTQLTIELLFSGVNKITDIATSTQTRSSHDTVLGDIKCSPDHMHSPPHPEIAGLS